MVTAPGVLGAIPSSAIFSEVGLERDSLRLVRIAEEIIE
jgi:hypothetical protein